MQERSRRWLALNEQKKKTTDRDTRNAISKEQAMLHAQNVADSKKIGARYERKTGEWTRTAGRGDNRHTESINGMRGMLGNPRELMQNSLPFQLGQQTGKVLYQGRNPKATLSDEDRAILHAMPTGQNAFQAFNQGTLGMQQPQSDHVASVKVTKRLSDAAASIGDTLVGMFPALAETGQQRAKNVAQERTQAGFTDLEAKQKQLQDALAVTPVSDSTGKLTDTYKALQAQLDEVNAQIERMSVNTPVDQSLFGQRKMRESREKAAAATVGMTGAGKFLADTGLSIANNAVTMPTALIHPSLPLLLMGTQAAASKTTELNERGAEPGEALARGLVSGGIEAATEKLPLENLLNTFATGAGKSVIRNLLKQSGTEAGEEAVSYVLNYIADKAAQDPEAQFSLAEMVQAAAGGAVSGGIMGGGALLGNYTMNRLGSNIESNFPAQPTMQERIQNEINDPESAVVDAQFDPEDIAPPVQQTTPQTVNEVRQMTPVQQETATQTVPVQMANEVQNAPEQAAQAPVQQTETAPMIGSNPEVRTMNQTDSYDVTGYTLSQDAIDLADELKQIGDVKTAVETLLPKYEALHDRALQDATDMPVDQVGKVDATESTGAAPAGFDPYSRAVNEYGAIEPGENPARVVDVPKSTDGETRVNRGARTILETAYTTDATRESIEKSIVETGIFSHGIATDKEAMEQATRVIRDKGFDGALQQWQDVTNGYQKADKNNLAMAIALYAASEKAGDTQLSTRLAAEIAAQGTLAGQEVQALRLLKKTTPEGQLYYMRKMVQGLNEKYEKRLEKRNNRQQNTTPDIQQETMDAFRQAQQEIDRNQEAPQNKSGTGRKQRRRGDTQNVPVEEWGTETGNDLAKRIADRLTPPQTQKPITRTILSDLLQFAEEHALPKKGKAPARTATDRLRDYFANKEFYVEAWEQAQKVLQERYAGDQNALDALAAFNRGTIGYNNDSAHTQKVILRALIDDIRDSGGWKEYLGRDALGAREQNVQQLADRLIRDTGVSGSDAEILRDAVQRNYPDMASRRSGVQLESMIRSALKQNDLTMGDVARMNENDRAATGRAIAAYLTEQYGVASDYVQNVSDVIAEEYNAQVQQRAHEILENRFKERGQRTPREFWDVFEEYANLGAFDGEYAQKATEKLFGYKNIILDESLARELVNTTDADARDEIIDRICRDIAEQIPGSWTQKADAIRYFSMLGRPTTHIRNIASNFMMVLPVSTKNKIGAVLEKALVKEADRTKSLTQADKATRDFAKADAERMKNVLQGGGNYSIEQMVRQYMQPFSNKHLLGKMLNKGSSLNSAALEFEDWIALGPQYRRALEGFIKARGLDVNTLIDENGNASAALEEARSYAIREAQKATFRDDSQIAAALNKFEKTSFLTRVLVGGEMPFKKTPINIVKRGIEYSPAGFLKAAKEFRDVHLGTKTMSEAIDTLASAITGTGLMAVGAALGSAGILHGAGSGDKKEQNLNSASGIQEYSIDLGALMNAIADAGEAIGLNMENFRVDENGGYTYTLDWTAPGSLPLFMGVEVYNAIWGDKADDSDAGAIAKFCEALLNITEPMFSMTMLNGIRSTLKSASYDDANPLTAALTSIVSSYAGQFVPSVLGSVARTIDDTRRTTYKNKSYTGEPTLDLFLQKQQNKIPGLSKKNIPYMDVFGNTDTEPNTALRVFENFLSPGYLQKKENSEAISGLRDLYRETGDASVLPNKAATSFSVDGKTKNLTQDEYQTFAQTRGKMIEDGLADLFRSSAYQNMGSEERVNAVSELYKHANAAAKAKISDYPMSDAQKRAADSGVPLGTYYAYKQTLDNLNAAKDEDARIKTAQQIADDSSLTQNEKNTLMLDILLSSDDSIAKYHETFESEFDPQTYITLLNEKSKINKMYNDEDDSESKKEGAWVKYLKASDLTDAQKAKAEEEMKFYRQMPATAYIDSFEMLEEYGGKQERAAAQEMQDAGVTLDMHNTAKEYKSSLTGTGKGQKERVIQWMRAQGWTEAQIEAEKKALYGESKGGSGGSSGGSSSGKSKNSKGGTGVKTPKIGIGLKLP